MTRKQVAEAFARFAAFRQCGHLRFLDRENMVEDIGNLAFDREFGDPIEGAFVVPCVPNGLHLAHIPLWRIA